MVKYTESQLDRVFSALGDRTRRAILARLADQECTVTELAEPFRMSLPAVSKHVRVLGEAGLVDKRRDGRIQRCKLQPDTLKQATDWLRRYRRFWEQSFDSLERHLKSSGK